jgi:murein DD-endopeptidase MepM/ murein hydrolase activator NlpD
VDPVRDLGRNEPWQESLERSQARRRKSSRASVERDQPERRRTDRPQARRHTANRSRILVRRAAGLAALAACIAVPLSALGGSGAQKARIAALAHAKPAPLAAAYADDGGPLSHWPVSPLIEQGLLRSCQPTSEPGDYVNPLRGAHVRPERIDQGVDYAGSGTLVAIGGATVTYVETAGTGWPGSFIEYRLLDGPDVGCYVYYAEGVNPAANLRVGETVAAGQPIATIVRGWSTGIELGWGAGVSTATYAAETHQWSATSDEDNVPSTAGKSFSALIAALGGPPGKVEG